MMTLIEDFISLFFPRVCNACEAPLMHNEEIICTSCLFHLPKTNFHRDQDNPVSSLFWGRVDIHAAAACYYFRKGSKIQHLMHQFKYKGHKEVGVFIGGLYGDELKKSPCFNTVNAVIPVPLHRKKIRKRGFNQSEQFAMGLSQSMKIDLVTSILVRKTASETQTKKTKFRRWENVKEIFDIEQAETLEGKHLLLVDDVITTGSTIEACATVLHQIHGVKVSVAGMAFTTF
jgi:ComF family protein